MLPDDPRHGTEAGCREHYRDAEKPCSPCLDAHRRRNIMRQLYPHKRPAIGSQRRIQALQALGYGRDRIAHELGYTDGGAITYLMQADTMLTVTAEKISDAYDRLSMKVPEGVGSNRARTWAKRHGFAPPLAWEGVDMEDPDAKAHGSGYRRLQYRNEELLAEWAFLESAGESIHVAASKLGVSVDAIEKALERAKKAAA